MAQAHGEHKTRLLDWNALVIGERLPTLSYVLTQAMVDEFRKGVMDPEAAYPTKWMCALITWCITTTAR